MEDGSSPAELQEFFAALKVAFGAFNVTLENVANLLQDASVNRPLAADAAWQERYKRELTDLATIGEQTKVLPAIPSELADLGPLLRKLRKEVRRAERAATGGDYRGAATHVQTLARTGMAINTVSERWEQALL